MSDEELIEGYTQGRISRRVFVRRLVAGGLSLVAAVAYGNALAAGPAAASPLRPAHHKHHKHHEHDHDRHDDHDDHEKHKKHKKHGKS